jgi:hypothetical protein
MNGVRGHVEDKGSAGVDQAVRALKTAFGGELREALSNDTVDDALLDGAGDIIRALITGGPAQDMADYADGAEATRQYCTPTFARHWRWRAATAPKEWGCVPGCRK